MDKTIQTLCAALFLITPLGAISADGAQPSSNFPDGVQWSIGDNEALPLVRGERAAYMFIVNKGKVALGVDSTTVNNIVGPSTVMLVGKEINLITKFSNGVASSGSIQRVSDFKLNSMIPNTKQGLQPAVFPQARFDTPRSFTFSVDGVADPSKLPEGCNDEEKSYVKLLVDGTALKVPGSPDTDARIPRNGGYIGKAKSIDWQIVGPSFCTFTVQFSLLPE